MSMIVMWFKKYCVIAVLAALGLGMVPIANAFALSPSDPTPPASPALKSTNRLERVWAREQLINTKVGLFLNNSERFITKAQTLIDKAKANGKDATALQAALDAFTNAVNQAKPIYKSAGSIVSTHQGFDQSGKVIDEAQARTTIEDLRSKFKEIRQLLLDPGKALRDAIQAYREANKPAVTPTPTQTGG